MAKSWSAQEALGHTTALPCAPSNVCELHKTFKVCLLSRGHRHNDEVATKLKHACQQTPSAYWTIFPDANAVMSEYFLIIYNVTGFCHM